MRSKFTSLQRQLASLSDFISVSKRFSSLNPFLPYPPLDPFELPYLKKPPPRIMPYYPERTLFVYRAKEVHRNAEEKKELKKKREAGGELQDEITTIFRVQIDEFDYHVVVPLPVQMPFEEAAKQMSISATTMLANRLARAQKKRNHMQGGEDPAAELFETSVQISVAGMTRCLKQTLLEDDVICVEILEKGQPKEMMPYTVRWIQYPMECVSVPFIPREGFPLAALFEPKKGAQMVVFNDAHRDATSYPNGLRYFWFTMEPNVGKGTAKDLIKWIQTGSGWRPQLRDAEFVCEAATFTPKAEHVGKYVAVAVSCLPSPRLPLLPLPPHASELPDAPDSFTEPSWTVSAKSTEPVVGEKMGEEMLATRKMQWAASDETKRKEEGDKSRLRLVSYNLLADQYINLAKPPAELFYPYVDKKFQHMRYRYSLLLKEIEGYAADIYMLQEVCQRMSIHYLPALFSERNYGYAFHRKYVEVREGSCLAWNLDRFTQSGNWCRWLTDVLAEEENGDIRELLSRAAPDDRKFFEERPTLVHIVLLKDTVTGATVIVGNTHLHHDPRHEHYKALQTALVTRELARRVREARESGLSNIRVLFGADLNSTPDAAVVQLLQQGFVAANDAVWDADILMGGMELRLPTELHGMQNLSGEPAFTNYTVHRKEGESETTGFVGCIDYIWACGMETIEVAPQPSIEEVKQHTALPSPIAPSDHLAIVLSARYSS